MDKFFRTSDIGLICTTELEKHILNYSTTVTKSVLNDLILIIDNTIN